MAGAVLIALPLLVMALDDDDRKETASSSAPADTVLEDDRSRAGAFVPESPSPKKTKPKKKPPARSPKAAAPQTAAPSPSKPAKKKKAAAKAPSDGLPATRTRVLIKNLTNATCADVPGGGYGYADGPIHQAVCNSTTEDNQLWNLEKKYENAGPGGSALFVIRNTKDGMCMDLPGNEGAPVATAVTEFPCNGSTSDNQLWWLDKKADGLYWIRNFASNHQCLDSQTADNEDRNLIVYICRPESQNNHQWYFTRS
ncbi:RICIN domain-containing protein [Streptomyces sp. NPDC047108]|uniref:RICIN domain-containing protein n=1 Tax=Streptomyces sp. NPDC047108 TaxID=3155025 RepID=UPI0033FD88DB